MPEAIQHSITDHEQELVRLADRIAALDTEIPRLSAELDAMAGGKREKAALARRIRDLVTECHQMREALPRMPARTMLGFKAKARIVRLFAERDADGSVFYEDEGLADSLAADLMAAA